MRPILFSFFLSFTSPAIFTLLLWLSNCFSLSISLTYLTLAAVLLVYIKRAEVKSSRKIIISFAILLALSLFFTHLHTLALISNKWPAFVFVSMQWPTVFESQRLYVNKTPTGYSLMFIEWNFEKPDCFVMEKSVKYWEKPVQYATFFYFSKKNVPKYFKDYIEKLKSKGFRESKLNLSPNRTFRYITILDSVTLENESKIVHCELLGWKNGKEAAIFVVVADKGEIDLLKKLLNNSDCGGDKKLAQNLELLVTQRFYWFEL